MASKQKIKGSTWERKCCEYLSKKYTLPFTRSPHSGAYIGGANGKRKVSLSAEAIATYAGDISIPTSLIGSIDAIECKNYADLPMHQIIMQDCPQLDEWINQASVHGDKWLLMVKITRKIEMIIAPTSMIGVGKIMYKDYCVKTISDWLV